MPRGKKIEGPLELSRREPYRSIVQIIGILGQEDKRARTQEAISKVLTRFFPCPNWSWLKDNVECLEKHISIVRLQRTKTTPQRVYSYLRTLVEYGVLVKAREDDLGCLYDLSDSFANMELVHGHIKRLEKSNLEQIWFFPLEHTVLYSGWLYDLDQSVVDEIYRNIGLIKEASKRIWRIQYESIRKLLERELRDIEKSSLPDHFKTFIFNALKSTELILLDRCDWWNDYSGATGILLEKARERLEEVGEPQEEIKPLYLRETLLERDTSPILEDSESPFPEFHDDEVRVLWLLRRFFGNLWEWNIGIFESLEERLSDEEKEKLTKRLTSEELENLRGFFEGYGVTKDTIIRLRELYHLIGEDFDPHIVVGPQFSN